MRCMIMVSMLALAAGRPVSAQDSYGPPQPAQPPSPAQPAMPPTPPGPGSPDLDQLMQAERQDFGVAATAQLHSGPMHAPTPSSIPGGQVITTRGLVELVKGQQVRALVFDIRA